MSLSFPIWYQRGQCGKCLRSNLCFKQTLEKWRLVLAFFFFFFFAFDMHEDTYPLSIISEREIEGEVLQESLLSP